MDTENADTAMEDNTAASPQRDPHIATHTYKAINQNTETQGNT